MRVKPKNAYTCTKSKDAHNNTHTRAFAQAGDFVLSSPKARKSATKRNRKAIEVKTQQVNANKRKRKASKSVGSGDALSTALAAANASPTEETNPPRTKGAPGYDSVFTIQVQLTFC